jgi:hypothetical protein
LQIGKVEPAFGIDGKCGVSSSDAGPVGLSVRRDVAGDEMEAPSVVSGTPDEAGGGGKSVWPGDVDASFESIDMLGSPVMR